MKTLFLALVFAVFGGVALGQTLSVLGDEPLNLMNLEGYFQVELENNTDQELITEFSIVERNEEGIELRRSESLPANNSDSILLDSGSRRNYTLTLPIDFRNSSESLYLVVRGADEETDELAVAIEKSISPEVKPEFTRVNTIIFWSIIAFAAAIILAAWNLGRRRKLGAKEFQRSWVAGTPEVNFKESIGSVSAILLATSNSALIPTFSDLLDPETKSLQVLGALLPIPILAAPMIMRAKIHKVSADKRLCGQYDKQMSEAESEDKVHKRRYLLASYVSLSGTLLQVYVLYEWLKLIDLSILEAIIPEFLGLPLSTFGWAALISLCVGLLITYIGYTTVHNAAFHLRICKYERSREVKPPLTQDAMDDLKAAIRDSASALTIIEEKPQRKLKNTLF